MDLRIPLLCLLLSLATGCSSAYYAGMETMGVPKRSILHRRVEKARDAQEDVKQQFSSALEQFRATVKVDGGALAERYDALNAEFERCQTRSDTLKQRIEALEDVADALFDEWQDELEQYKRPELRRASERRLSETRRRYQPMVAAMKRAHARVEDVLDSFRDVVLALKHELNAHAIGSLKAEVTGVEREVDALIAAMNASIKQAGHFLQSLEGQDDADPGARAPGPAASPAP